MNPKNIARLKHILDSINKIEEVFNELNYEKFVEDWRSQDVIIRNLEIIGEAANRIDNDVKEKYPEVQWIYATAMRNFLIHKYFDVDVKAVWNTIEIDIPVLKIQIQKIVENFVDF